MTMTDSEKAFIELTESHWVQEWGNEDFFHAGWESYKESVQSMRCDGCKNSDEEITCDHNTIYLTCACLPCDEIREVPNDFYCKYWEPKTP